MSTGAVSSAATGAATGEKSAEDSGLDPRMIALMIMMGLIKPPQPPPIMKKGDVLKGYEFLGMLGKGGFGEVWAVKKDDDLFAIKAMRNNDSAEQELLFSDKFHLTSPFLVKYYESFKSDDNKIVFIVMELCEQGDLDDLVYAVNPDKSRKLNYAKGIGLQPHRIVKIFTQLVLGLHELHIHKIIHRDLKLGNIFVDENDNIKIGDFGASRVLESVSDLRKTMIGTPSYMSPEQYLSQAYGQGVDLWALGVMAYELCMGRMPFEGKTRDEIEEKIKIGKYDPIKKLTVPNEIIDAISRLLDKNPKLRPSTRELLSIPIIQECAVDSGLFQYFPKDIPAKVSDPSSAGGSWSTSPPPPSGGPSSPPSSFSSVPSSSPPPLPVGAGAGSGAAAHASLVAAPLDKEDFARATADAGAGESSLASIQRAASAGQQLFTANIAYMYGGSRIEIRQPVRPFSILKLNSKTATATAQDVKASFSRLVKTPDRQLRALVCLAHTMALSHVYKTSNTAYIQRQADSGGEPAYRFDAASPIVWALTGHTPALRALAVAQAKLAEPSPQSVKFIQTAFHESLLYLAARSNMVDVAEFLLELGAFINDMRSGSSVLNAATFYGHEYLSHYLVRRGANPFAKKPGGGSSPLEEAAAASRPALTTTAQHPVPAFLRSVLSLREMGETQHILFNGEVVAYRLPKTLSEKLRVQYEASWYGGWHGTQRKFIPSIIQHGLLKPGTSVGSTVVAVPSGRPTDAIYVTKAVRNECEEVYTEKMGQFCLLVEAFVRPGSYTEQLSARGGGGYKLARVEKADSVVVTAIALVRLDFIKGPAASSLLSGDKLLALLRGRLVG